MIHKIKLFIISVVFILIMICMWHIDPRKLKNSTLGGNVYYPLEVIANGNIRGNHQSSDPKTVKLNVTSSTGRILIYNRVPKCGSTSLWNVIKTLSKVNKFQKLRSKEYFEHSLNIEEQDSILKYLLIVNGKKFTIFDRHMYYFDTERSAASEDYIWMNFVREPVDRFISDFYFIRSDHFRAIRKGPPPDESFYKQDLNECIWDRTSSCLPLIGDDFELPLTYFCGHHPDCRKVGSRWALEQAKQNVEKHYSVVGVLEELDLSYKVLQHLLPRFFNNLANVIKDVPHKNMNTEKRSVKNETKAIIAARLQEDVEFYDFLKQRLHLQEKYITNLSSR